MGLLKKMEHPPNLLINHHDSKFANLVTRKPFSDKPKYDSDLVESKFFILTSC